METKWPPTGFSDPKKYEKSDPIILGITILIAAGLGLACASYLMEGINSFVHGWLNLGVAVGVTDPLLLRLGGVGVAVLGLSVVWTKIVIPVHERIHYEVGKFYDLDPEYGTEDFFFTSNPCVTAMSPGITVKENIAMLTAPFLLIGIPALAVMMVSSGILTGLAAYVLVANSAGAAQDLYHTGRLLLMPNGTQFANFEADGDIRTEYASPEQ